MNSIQISVIEDTLKIRSWGYEASREVNQKRYPGWVVAMMKQGYRERPKVRPPSISDDYYMLLDGMITKLPEQQQEVLFYLYFFNRGLRQAGKTMDATKETIADIRDAALWTLYGGLKYQESA